MQRRVFLRYAASAAVGALLPRKPHPHPSRTPTPTPTPSPPPPSGAVYGAAYTATY